MDAYDSDSSGAADREYTETNVLVGFASKTPTDDNISKLGGYPTWIDEKYPPPASLANCQVCNKNMSLLLQLNCDMPEHFPGHERRLYIQACRQRQCRRKDGSVRSFRGTKISPSQMKIERAKTGPSTAQSTAEFTPKRDLGSAIFGGNSTNLLNAGTNPFSASAPSASNPFSSTSSAAPLNPFSSPSSLAAKAPQPPTTTAPSNAATATNLAETFASKARISSVPSPQASQPVEPPTPWPSQSSFPAPYPTYHLDADYETLSPESPSSIPASARVDNDFDIAESSAGGSGATNKEDKEAFESSLDKIFQKFADRVAQNPEQVLRYEFRGQPLLYSKSDAVGKLLAPHQSQPVSIAKVQSTSASGTSGIPRCGNCGAERVFEVQLTPHAIAELEAEETGLEGMDWGTVILGVCGKDCVPPGTRIGDGEVGWVEEWTGVQWEEVVDKSRR